MSNLHSKQILALLQVEKFYLVKVRFKHSKMNPRTILLAEYPEVPLSEKTYTYKVPNFVSLTTEDEVIVESPFNGMVVVKVVEIVQDGVLLDRQFTESNGYKWIVQKVFPQKYRKQLAKEAEAEQLIAKQLAKQARQRAMESILAMFDEPIAIEQVRELLEEKS